MPRQSNYLKRIQAAQAIREQDVRRHARVFQMDMVTLALGRMGWREARFREFDKALSQVAMEYGTEIIEDAAVDPDLWYSKDTLDRELAQYVGALFVPYDERYK